MIRRLRPLGWLALILAVAPPGSAAEPRASSFGFGYDRPPGYDYRAFAGLGVRFHSDHGWGLGLRTNPSYRLSRDEFLDQNFDSDSMGDRLSERDFDSDESSFGFEIEVMAFHETRLGRWLSLGPFASMSYRYSRLEDEDTFDRLDSDGEFYRTTDFTVSRSHGAAVTLGLRPTFHLSEHFVLESRFGLGVRFTDYTREYDERRVGTTSSGAEVLTIYETDSESRDWSSGTFGESLGLSSVLAFMIYI